MENLKKELEEIKDRYQVSNDEQAVVVSKKTVGQSQISLDYEVLSRILSPKKFKSNFENSVNLFKSDEKKQKFYDEIMQEFEKIKIEFDYVFRFLLRKTTPEPVNT